MYPNVGAFRADIGALPVSEKKVTDHERHPCFDRQTRP